MFIRSLIFKNYIANSIYSSGNSDDFFKLLQLVKKMLQIRVNYFLNNFSLFEFLKPEDIVKAGITAKQFLDNWLTPPNYPIIDIDVNFVQLDNKQLGQVSLRQSRFLISESFDSDLNPEPLPYFFLN